MLFLELNAPDQILEMINFQVQFCEDSSAHKTNLDNDVNMGVDRLLQHALNPPPSKGGELPSNAVIIHLLSNLQQVTPMMCP